MGSEADRLKLVLQLSVQDDQVRVRTTAQGGQCRAQAPLPPQGLLGRLVEDHRVSIPQPLLKSVGQGLYRCLMAGDGARLAAGVFEAASRAKRRVHMELRFDPDQTVLARYPWETIADEMGRFLVRDGLADVTRYITYPQPPPLLDGVLHQLPILQVIAQPATLPPLLIPDLGVQRIETLSHATFEQLQYKLLVERAAMWGLHFHGHGALVLQCPTCGRLDSLDRYACHRCGASLSGAQKVGVLAFERDGDAEWITTEEFGAVLYNTQIRLALLLACETARVGDRLVFSGLAPGLILAGVPAVIGMQVPVTDRFANHFAQGFYQRLLRSRDLLDAMWTARAMTLRESWYSPVLYLRHEAKPGTEEATGPTYATRDVDTAVPSEVQAGVEFLVRLWIRRPATRPLTQEQLRKELGVLTPVPISVREARAEVRFEPVRGRRLRRGSVQIECRSPSCSVSPERIKLFVDEHLDAPPAIFTVRSRKPGRVALHFTIWQDGGQIAAVAHSLQVLGSHQNPQAIIDTKTQAIPVRDAVEEALGRGWHPPSVPGLRLIGQTGPAAGNEVSLKQGALTIGRESTNDWILADTKLSRHHAEIRLQDRNWVLADLGSTNGSFVNGARVTGPRPLRSGDQIKIGRSTILVAESEAAISTEGEALALEPEPPPAPDRAPAAWSRPAAAREARDEPGPPRKRRSRAGGGVMAALLAVLLVGGLGVGAVYLGSDSGGEILEAVPTLIIVEGLEYVPESLVEEAPFSDPGVWVVIIGLLVLIAAVALLLVILLRRRRKRRRR